jgi:putative spermidine/putrescine transport system ATP-binding protein/putrescine transport system ATP-binding protein
MNVVELRNVVKHFGAVTAVDDVSFSVAKGQIVALLGPSGCGKTTTLRLIAGFLDADAGDIFIGGETMKGRRPYERNIGLVFQDYALFPHMTVEQNIAYGMRYRGVDKREIPGRTADILRLVKLSGLEKRRPAQLSGGQQQRVALARALVTRPAVMLLDEPLSNLDAKLRIEVRVELQEILTAAGSTTIVVTHDQEEAMSLAHNIVVMSDGRVMQEGGAEDIYARPTRKFVAEFIGHSNWFAGELVDRGTGGAQGFRTEDGLLLVVPAGNGRGRVEIGVRPERVTAAAPGTGGLAANELAGEVEHVEYLGASIHLWVKLPSGRRLQVVDKNSGQIPHKSGHPIVLRFGVEDCIVVPAEGS